MGVAQTIWDDKEWATREPLTDQNVDLSAQLHSVSWAGVTVLYSAKEPDPTGKPPIDWSALNREFS